MSSRRTARNKTVSSVNVTIAAGSDAPATATEQENKSPANVNTIDNAVEAVAESNQGSESEIQCGICFDDIACRGVIDSCEHTFCFTCIQNWSKVTNLCPFCKAKFNTLQKQTLKGAPAKDENKKWKIKNKTQKQPDNFDIRDFISSEEEYSFADDEDLEDGEYNDRNGLPANIRAQIHHLARNYQRRGFNVNIDFAPGDPLHIIIDDEGASDEEVVTLGQGSRRHPPRAGAGQNRARNNDNRRRRAADGVEAEMADFIVPDDDWEMQSAEPSYDSGDLSDDELMADEPRRPAQKRRRPAATNNSRSTGRNINPRTRPHTGARNNNGNVTRAPRRTVSRANSNNVIAPIAIDDDIPFIDATGDIPILNDGTLSQEDALAIAQALQDNENEVIREEEQRRISYDSDDDEITLRSRRKVRRTN